MNSFVSTTAIAAEPQTATEEVVRLTDVKRRFGTTAALDGISLTVKRGEILGIIGRSGAGKSTLIRCLNGWSAPIAARSSSKAEISPDFQNRTCSRCAAASA